MASSASSVVLFERKGHVAVFTLNRPSARNAVNAELVSGQSYHAVYNTHTHTHTHTHTDTHSLTHTHTLTHSLTHSLTHVCACGRDVAFIHLHRDIRSLTDRELGLLD